MSLWTSKAIDDKLKILVPTTQVIRAQLEGAAAKGTDLDIVIQNKNAQLYKKLNKVKLDLEKLNIRMNKPGYNDSVPNTVKEKNK
jgi:valyl-tRNA synthetase